jgi:hypothetical protein
VQLARQALLVLLALPDPLARQVQPALLAQLALQDLPIFLARPTIWSNLLPRLQVATA